MKNVLKTIALIILALGIPSLLIFQGFQSKRYAKLEDEIRKLEIQQADLIEKNNQLISEINLLSSSERIEKIATEELGMRKADSSEIIRVEVTGGKK
ncbi:MAG: cell division protein FtsL [Treponema sp.]|nr:cell division protein FtsL [Treponema sp.]